MKRKVPESFKNSLLGFNIGLLGVTLANNETEDGLSTTDLCEIVTVIGECWLCELTLPKPITECVDYLWTRSSLELTIKRIVENGRYIIDKLEEIPDEDFRYEFASDITHSMYDWWCSTIGIDKYYRNLLMCENNDNTYRVNSEPGPLDWYPETQKVIDEHDKLKAVWTDFVALGERPEIVNKIVPITYTNLYDNLRAQVTIVRDPDECKFPWFLADSLKQIASS